MKAFHGLSGKNFFIVSLAIIFLAACAGSRSDSSNSEKRKAEDDYLAELLGISENKNETKQTPPAQQTPPQEEDNLLNLLQENEPLPEPEKKVETPPKKTESQAVLEQELEDMKKKMAEKERTIGILKDQVETLETTPQTPAPSTSRSTAYGSDSYQQRYDTGFNLFQSRRYRDAIGVFEGLLATSTTHSLSDNAQYWIGESYYALGDYSAAIVAFEKVFTYKNSNKNDYAQFKLGQCYYLLKDYSRSRQEFQTLIDNYKNSYLISKAQNYLGRM